MTTQPDIFTLDAAAVKFGGEKAGAYLDLLGKSDLATMTGAEWHTFCTHMVEGAWRFALDRHITKLERPLTDAEVPF